MPGLLGRGCSVRFPGCDVAGVKRPRTIERRMNRFLREPISVRNAASVIVTATFIVVVGGGIAIRAIDHREYSSIWEGMWWSVQTVTTVGYGDVTPKHSRQDRRRDRDARGDSVPCDRHGRDHLGVRDAGAARAEIRSTGAGNLRGNTRRPAAQTDCRAAGASRVATAGAHETVSHIAAGPQSATAPAPMAGIRPRHGGRAHPPPNRMIPNAGPSLLVSMARVARTVRAVRRSAQRAAPAQT